MIQALLAVAKAEGLDPLERALLVVLADFANKEGVAWPSRASLARRFGRSKRMTTRILRRVEAKGLVETRVRPGGGYEHHLNLAALEALAKGPARVDGCAKAPKGWTDGTPPRVASPKGRTPMTTPPARGGLAAPRWWTNMTTLPGWTGPRGWSDVSTGVVRYDHGGGQICPPNPQAKGQENTVQNATPQIAATTEPPIEPPIEPPTSSSPPIVPPKGGEDEEGGKTLPPEGKEVSPSGDGVPTGMDPAHGRLSLEAGKSRPAGPPLAGDGVKGVSPPLPRAQSGPSPVKGPVPLGQAAQEALSQVQMTREEALAEVARWRRPAPPPQAPEGMVRTLVEAGVWERLLSLRRYARDNRAWQEWLAGPLAAFWRAATPEAFTRALAEALEVLARRPDVGRPFGYLERILQERLAPPPVAEPPPVAYSREELEPLLAPGVPLRNGRLGRFLDFVGTGPHLKVLVWDEVEDQVGLLPVAEALARVGRGAGVPGR